ncbi:acetyl-CoA C-acyltransferase, partial [Pseudomonas sp. HMWF031]
MREAMIVSTARTPIGKATRGSLNNIKSPTLMGHALRHAVERAGIDPALIEDVVIGTVLAAGTAGSNLARNAVFAAGLPLSVSGMTVDRQCSSGLMAIATAARQIVHDGMQVVAAGGQENISAVQQQYFRWVADEQDPAVLQAVPHAYMPMLQTAENVALKYGISREAQDQYAFTSQQRTALAQAQGRMREEIVPISALQRIVDKASGASYVQAVLLERDEG